MPKKYNNKYRIKTHRKPNWDYNKNGTYFITICTQDGVHNLGKIVKTNGRAHLKTSYFGKIVETEWQKSFEIRNEIFCDEYIIMPNHLHGIIILENDNDPIHLKNITINNEIIDDKIAYDDIAVQTHGRASLRESSNESPSSNNLTPPININPFYRLPKSISSFIGGFKSSVNSKIDDFIDANNLNIPKYNRNNHFFQPNYHDIIIRNKNAHHNIKQYIINNPINWDSDKFKY